MLQYRGRVAIGSAIGHASPPAVGIKLGAPRAPRRAAKRLWRPSSACVAALLRSRVKRSRSKPFVSASAIKVSSSDGLSASR